MTSSADLSFGAPAPIREIDATEAEQRRSAGGALLDVREQVEWDAGHIPGAAFIPQGELPDRIEAEFPDKDAPIVLYCRSGARSGRATQLLQRLGYTDVVNMAGGILAWAEHDLPIEAPASLTPAQQSRYSRHLLIPEVGTAGQVKLLESKVLMIGAGGLGSPAALYLAAAGVGTLGIVDFDVVEASNLQRQVIHSTDRLGTKKVDSARQTIQALNPDVNVVGYDVMLVADNVEQLIAGYDVILDGTDTFETRYLLNDAAVAAGIPVVHASVFRFEGQLTTFIPYEGPCYRCLYPTPPPPELAPGCSVAGVLGVVPGIMGMLQANEVLKVLLGIGDPLVGRLQLFDALDGTFSELRLSRDPKCPVCSDEARAARERGERISLPNVSQDQPFALGSFGAGSAGASIGGSVGGSMGGPAR
jgi:molybdopterin/thiamine biosynthesis adenylyltransferase/rhodanese-related sulfurtransferase